METVLGVLLTLVAFVVGGALARMAESHAKAWSERMRSRLMKGGDEP